MRKNCKNILKVVSYLLLCVSISLATIPTSESKYVKADQEAAIYDTAFYKLFQGETGTSLTKSTPEYDEVNGNAIFEFTFGTNILALDEVSDTYRLIVTGLVDETKVDCSIENESFDFGSRTEITNETTRISCPISRTNKTVILSVDVRENIASEGEFAYLSTTKTFEYDLEEKEDPAPEDHTTIIIDKNDPETGNEKTNKEILDELYEQMIDYAQKTGNPDSISSIVTDNILQEFVESLFTGEPPLIDEENVTDFDIPGIVISEDDGTYIYDIYDYISTIARTYYETSHSDYIMYFTDIPYAITEEVFDFYMDNYYDMYTADEKEDIKNYVATSGEWLNHGVNALLAGKTSSISGIIYTYPETSLVLSPNIIDYATMTADIKVRSTLSTAMFKYAYENINMYYSNYISSELSQVLYEDETVPLYDSIAKNCTDEYCEKPGVFEDHYSFFDETLNKYVHFKVFRKEKEDFNRVEITNFENIYDETGTTLISIALTGKNKDSLEGAVAYLNDLYEESIYINDEDITKTESGDLKFNYIISEPETTVLNSLSTSFKNFVPLIDKMYRQSLIVKIFNI